MKIRKLLGTALTVPALIGALLLVTAGPAVACSCARFRSEAERAARADAVFMGTLVSQVNRIDWAARAAGDELAREFTSTSDRAARADRIRELMRKLRSDSSRVVLTFEVSRVYKGAVGERQEIVTPPGRPGSSTCGGLDVPAGEPFLVFASQESPELSRRYQLDVGQYMSGWCSGSRPLAHGGNPDFGGPSAGGTGGLDSWPAMTQLAVGVGVLAAGVAAGLGLLVATVRGARGSHVRLISGLAAPRSGDVGRMTSTFSSVADGRARPWEAYQQNTGNRCADRRFPRSPATVGVEVKCSHSVQLNGLLTRSGLR